jgi:predicted aspartyl protease
MEATVSLRLRSPGGFESQIDAVIDTAYTGTLTLSARRCMSLGLPIRSKLMTILADGSRRRVDSFTAELHWGGIWRVIAVTAIDTAPLIGMALLRGYRLEVDFVAGGEVLVRPIVSPTNPP